MTIYNWSADYGQGVRADRGSGHAPRQPASAEPAGSQGAPVLILGTRRKRYLTWDGRRGTVANYAGDRLGVSVPGKIADVIAESWALTGDASRAGQRPRTGDRVILEDGALATVEDADGDPWLHSGCGRRKAADQELVGDRAARYLI